MKPDGRNPANPVPIGPDLAAVTPSEQVAMPAHGIVSGAGAGDADLIRE
jgi:hypothetical protein